MSIPGDDFFIIKLDKIITMTEITDENFIEFYNRYLEDDDDDMPLSQNSSSSPGKAEVTKNMGYVSSVEDARKTLEKIYKDLKES
jgi:predicted transcriptional regulator